MQVAAQTVSPPDFASQRQTMVDCQVRTFDVTDLDVIRRFEDVPRDLFMPAPIKSLAYSDAPLEVRSPEGNVRGLLAPLVLARMIQGAQVNAGDRLLDIAGAFGYTAAILAGLAQSVVALESSRGFTAEAANNFKALGIGNATAVTGRLDGSELPEEATFDVIFVNCGVEAGLSDLIRRLSPNGRLLAILVTDAGAVGRAGKATRFDRVGPDASRRALFDTTAPVLVEFRRPPGFVF